jgi:hypothetical protein
MENSYNIQEVSDRTQTELCISDASSGSFHHYEIFMNGIRIKDVDTFDRVVDYINKNFLYGKISYVKHF